MPEARGNCQKNQCSAPNYLTVRSEAASAAMKTSSSPTRSRDAVFFSAACIKRNDCRSVSWRIFSPGFMPGFPCSPESLSRHKIPSNSSGWPAALPAPRSPPIASGAMTASRTGSTLRLLDPLDWIHAVTAHIPDRGRHCVRYYGAFANRARSPKVFTEQQTPPAAGPGASEDTSSEFVQRSRASWARLIKKIFEVDPLLCSCGAEMKIVSFITDPLLVDRILRHLENQERRAPNPFEPRAPPQAGGNSLQ